MTTLHLFNSLTRKLEPFVPVHAHEARVYSCGPTVYNYPHIGNMRAYVFADILGRTLSFKGYKLTHVINITDVGHLTDDADAGEDKMEKMAAEKAQSIWDIAEHYKQAYWADVRALNIRQPAQWTVATDYVPQMIEFAKKLEADGYCYRLESGLYFSTDKVLDYGILATDEPVLTALRSIAAKLATLKNETDQRQMLQQLRSDVNSTVLTLTAKAGADAQGTVVEILREWERVQASEDADFYRLLPEAIKNSRLILLQSRIEDGEAKESAEDFAIWRKTPSGETRQMEWDSPWGRGAPGWHLECSVMSHEVLGFPFDIHTGGIDHRQVHHPAEIAQNQAFCGCGSLEIAENSGARLWMHNNFLVERSGKMSKSSGEFLRLQLLIDKGYHPLAYRLMCLQAHYRSELEFSWEGLGAALTRLKRMLSAAQAALAAAGAPPTAEWTADSARAEVGGAFLPMLARFEEAVSDDLGTPIALTVLEEVLAAKKLDPVHKLQMIAACDAVLGLNLLTLARTDLRLRPAAATITENEIEAILAQRKEARAAKDFAASDALRDALAARGVEVMDGDALGWEWKL